MPSAKSQQRLQAVRPNLVVARKDFNRDKPSDIFFRLDCVSVLIIDGPATAPQLMARSPLLGGDYSVSGLGSAVIIMALFYPA